MLQRAKIKPPVIDGRNGKENINIRLPEIISAGKSFNRFERIPFSKKQNAKKENRKMSESNKELNRTAKGTDENKSNRLNKSDLPKGKAIEIKRKALQSAPPKICREKQTAENKKKRPAERKISNKREIPMTNISAIIVGKRIKNPNIHKSFGTDCFRISRPEAVQRRIKRETDFRREINGKKSTQFIFRENDADR